MKYIEGCRGMFCAHFAALCANVAACAFTVCSNVENAFLARRTAVISISLRISESALRRGAKQTFGAKAKACGRRSRAAALAEWRSGGGKTGWRRGVVKAKWRLVMLAWRPSGGVRRLLAWHDAGEEGDIAHRP
jgi:hypothetical protein